MGLEIFWLTTAVRGELGQLPLHLKES